MRYLFEIAYLGTHYHGWQIQPNAITVQEVVNDALSKLCKTPINISGSGRTDTGVHCSQQFFHADISGDIDTSKLHYRLNSLLPFDISIQSIRPIKEDSHARFDADKRKYEYRISSIKDPFTKGITYYFNKPLDIPTMNEAAALLLGDAKDFECFSKVKTEVNNFMCTITEARWESTTHGITFHIAANRFLRGMVRAIVGTLIDVGMGKLTPDDFAAIIHSKDRTKAGRSAPAEGLFLTQVNYPQDIFIP